MTKDNFQWQKLLIGIFSILLLVILIIVAWVEMRITREVEPRIVIDKITQQCISCHESRGTAVKLIDEWRASVHAQQAVGCYDCHEAAEDDWDAYRCPESEFIIAKHPTTANCNECHEDEVAQFMNSKHAVSQIMMSLKGPDRNVFQPTIASKHGCTQCHKIGMYWPDGSVGDCSVCHSKHQFSIAQARRSETCGECHIGPDHPHIEIYLESKHGNIYSTFGEQWDWTYPSGERVPFNTPTCATCHMSAAPPGVKATHNVSERLAWETQSPYSIRTTEYWGDVSWEQKRERMEAVCGQCHARSFYDMYLFTADLNVLQYNEIYRTMVNYVNEWNQKYKFARTTDFYQDGRKLTAWPKEGYDEPAEVLTYNTWHHEGRRFRHGAIMMGADYTQWYGIWDLQQNFVDLMNLGADHGIPEAVEWVNSNDPNKFLLYPLYDVPGNAWGICAIAYKGSLPMTRIDNYWEKIYNNVHAVYEHGIITEVQWNLFIYRYENKDKYMGLIYDYPEIHDEFMKALDRDLVDEVRRQVLDLKLPSESPWRPTRSK